MSETPSEQCPDRPLAEAIAVATRSVHAKLNKLIVARLPLALPPRTTDPAIYISGLLHIAPIYTTFEAIWCNILDAPPAPNPEDDLLDGCDPTIPILDTSSILEPNDEDAKVHQSAVCARIHSLLEHLHLPGLMRSDRLRADIKALSGWPEHVVEEQLKIVAQTGRLGEFIQHIKRSVENRPHVLLAHSYILFMALFAGGRFIRACLESVGSDFWEQVPSPVKPVLRPCRRDSVRTSEPASGLSEDDVPEYDFNFHASHTMPLRFFHFPTPMDGEDLKKEFKRRLADSEKLLTEREKQEIVKEAVCIFDNMTLIVQQLDSVCDEPNRKEDDPEMLENDLASLLKNPLRARLRDSIAITRERKERSSRFTSSSEDSPSTHPNRARDTRLASLRGSTGELYIPEHQNVDMHDVGLCPGLSKSMRFQKSLPRLSTHNLDVQVDTGIGLADNFKTVAKNIQAVHVVKWLIIFGFGAVILGAALSARRTLGER
ncbi:Fc.00g049890.m01.CDS01 [Cosmosporella sp. VM-42]